MPVSAYDVAAALRERLPSMGMTKLLKLLYYCQGHHLAAFGEPLFTEPIYAWDKGPVIVSVWRSSDPYQGSASTMDEAQLNTVGYVVSRYGGMSGVRLSKQTHDEKPWTTVDEHRKAGGNGLIELELIERYFRDLDDMDAPGELRLPADQVAKLLEGAEDRRDQPARVDTPAMILARLAGRD